MFGIDTYTFGTVWPSLLGVVAMAGVMTWGFFKVKYLMNEDQKK